jgi:hypothetical protein
LPWTAGLVHVSATANDDALDPAFDRRRAVFLSISSDAATDDANDLAIVRIRAVLLSISSDAATDAAFDLAHERTRAVHPVTALRAVWKAEVWCLT